MIEYMQWANIEDQEAFSDILQAMDNVYVKKITDKRNKQMKRQKRKIK